LQDKQFHFNSCVNKSFLFQDDLVVMGQRDFTMNYGDATRMVEYGGAAYSAKLLILSAVALAGQPLQTLAEIAGQTARLCCVAEKYYRVWYAVRSVCALEFVADAV
jgi:hypothetical protein